MDDTYVDFFIINEYLLRKLYEVRAKPLAFLLALDHVQSLDQYRGKCKINCVRPINKARLKKITGEETPPEVPSDLTPILLIVKNKICFSSTFISEFVGSQRSHPIIIVRGQAEQTSSQSSPPIEEKKVINKNSWCHSNNLFGYKMTKTGFDWSEANRLLATLSSTLDLDGLCQWREKKSRPQLPVNANAVMSEFKVYSHKPIDFSQAPLKTETVEVKYRERKLTNDE